MFNVARKMQKRRRRKRKKRLNGKTDDKSEQNARGNEDENYGKQSHQNVKKKHKK